ncbi:MAG: HlyD family efflux transporter periplasmic adaptor subunit, partial [Alphaproteobacteria bacterium]|nr:HlyD family efflux transporter periplasmic adaptor subunit [Alphaproteobacteria bacterium]
QLARLQVGQRVRLAVDAFPDRPLEGRVESFSPASGAVFSLLPPENATGNFTKIVQRVPVRIAVAPEIAAAGLLRPGLSVVARVETRGGDGAVAATPAR